MKILFLDIDGVVNCQTTPQTDGWPIDPYMAFLIGRIVDRTGCKVVLSSSWRHSLEGIEKVNQRVVKIIGTTTQNANAGAVRQYGTISRGTEIKMWLDEHPTVLCDSPTACPPGTRAMCQGHPIERYAILDDNGDMLDEQKPNFFQTSWLTGITEEIAKKVEEHLSD